MGLGFGGRARVRGRARVEGSGVGLACSRPLVAKDSKPKMSRIPMQGAVGPPLDASSLPFRKRTWLEG